MRILVTGAGGQLGAALGDAIQARGHDPVLLDRATLDVTDALAVEGVLRAAMADVVVHAAAWTDVDGCEQAPERARAVIVDGTRNVVLGAGKAFAIVVSTDYVFDGTLGRAYVETDEPNPLQVYGAAKLDAERKAVVISDRVANVRTAWLHGPRTGAGERPRNFVTGILRAAETGSLRVVADQIGSPTSVLDLAPALVELAEARAAGVFHVANRGEASRADQARALLREAGLDPAMVQDVATAEAPPRPARRPARTPLEGKAWRKAGFRELPSWEEGLARTMRALLA